MTQRMPAGTGLVGRVLEQRKPVVVDRYAELPQPLENESLANLEAGVAVPI